MEKIISIVNHKGGVGKTTVTENFAVELAKRGNRVLLVDLDSQGNLSKACGIKNAQYTIGNMLESAMEEKEIDAGLYACRTGIHQNIDIIPCSIGFANTKLKLNLFVARERVLKCALQEVLAQREYDFVLIDNAPSIDVDFQNSLVASDELLIVTEAEEFSVDGMMSLIAEYKKIKKYYNAGLKLAGVVINKVDARTTISKEMVSYIKKVFNDFYVFENVIPMSVKVRESQALRVSLDEHAKDSKVNTGFASFAEEYLTREMKEQ